MKKLLLVLVIIASLLNPLQAFAKSNLNLNLNFKYDSLMVGIHNTSNTHMTDTAFRKYYISQFPKFYTNMVISSRTYNWYKTQNKTKIENHNCGVACTSMIMKWYDETLDESVDDLRTELGHENGMGFPTEFSQTLTKKSIPSETITNLTIDSIYEVLKKGGVIQIAYNIKISPHALLINGYYEFGGKKYITYYDPRGNDKAYRLDEIDDAYYSQNYNYCISSWDDFSKKLYTDYGVVVYPKK